MVVTSFTSMSLLWIHIPVESEPRNITLLVAVLHLMHEDPMRAPLDICVQRGKM